MMGKLLLYGKQIALEGKEVIYHSLIAKYRADLPSKFTRGSYFITCINSPIVRLFQTAYGKFDLQYWDPNRTIVKGLRPLLILHR